MVQFGGQTAIKLTKALDRDGRVDPGHLRARHRRGGRPRRVRRDSGEQCGIPRPAGQTVFTTEEALAAAHQLEYPVLVRPSYVLGGQGMEIARSDADIIEFMKIITSHMEIKEHPILVDKYVDGSRVRGGCVRRHGRLSDSGHHAFGARRRAPGDSFRCILRRPLPHDDLHGWWSIPADWRVRCGTRVLINIQYCRRSDTRLRHRGQDPRSSRTVPYISKVTGVPIVKPRHAGDSRRQAQRYGLRHGLYKKSKSSRSRCRCSPSRNSSTPIPAWGRK